MRISRDTIIRNFNILGIKGSQYFSKRIMRDLDDIDIYLKNAEHVEKKRYMFTCTPCTRAELVPDERTSPPVESGESFYKDPDCREPCTGISTIPGTNHILWKTDIVLNSMYLWSGNDVFRYLVHPEQFQLQDIQVYGTSPDEEDEAYDLLAGSQRIFPVTGETVSRHPIRIIKNNIKTGEIIVESLPESGCFTIRTDTHTIRRQRNAIEMLKQGSGRHLRPLLRLFDNEEYAQWEPVHSENLSYYVLTELERSGIDEQRDFVKKAVGTPDFAILEGPPGSGKTTSILEVIAQYTTLSKKVLLVASTHVAVDNVIERLIEVRKDGTSLMGECGISPIRIGLEENVSEKVLGFTLEKKVETERKRIIRHLRTLSEHTMLFPSQKNLLSFLENADKDTFHQAIGKMILDSSNLVCGTTLGIMQTPEIKNLTEPEPVFDLLILDEASKTTFQEFLVPALYAKKWILSGDCRQLSPYVERDQIIRNLTHVAGFSPGTAMRDKMVSRLIFSFIQKNEAEKRVIIQCKNTYIQKELNTYLHAQIEAVNLIEGLSGWHMPEISCISSPAGFNCLEKTNYPFRLILTLSNCMKAVSRQEKGLEKLTSVWSDTESGISVFFSTGTSLPEKTWEEEIFWRMERIHELGKNSLSSRYSAEIQALLPHFSRDGQIGKERAQHIRNEIDRIQRIAFPSVLEILQYGIHGRKKSGTLKNAMNMGLTYGRDDNPVFTFRHTLLTYQHRMHPDISVFPRNTIYANSALYDGADIEKRRDWNDPFGYETRNLWIHIEASRSEKGQGNMKYNLAEVREMINRLNQFIEWAKDNTNSDNPDGIWNVALLSFYKGQTKELMSAVQHISGKSGHYQDFIVPGAPVQVTICTVDRFQGHEADLVILSFVRGKNDGYGFLDCKNRLNVALTRARYQQLLIGDKNHYKRSNHQILKELGTIVDTRPIGGIS